MTEYRLARSQRVPSPIEEVFPFYADPRNLTVLTPPWLGLTILGSGDGDETASIEMRKGLRIHYRVRPLGVPQSWTSEITDWSPPHRFVDEQRRGPYRRWHHVHAFRSLEDGTEIIDVVNYALPFGVLGALAHTLLVKRQLRAIFDYREAKIRARFGEIES